MNYDKYLQGISEACEHTNHLMSVEDIIGSLEKGDSILKDFGDGFAIYDSVQSKTGLLIRIKVIAGSNMEQWIDQVDQEAMLLATQYKAIGIIAIGRTGWKRECLKRNYKTTHSIFYKDVDHA
ncbi:hypothetical protein UFOVP1590_9 [uncultured Caudovirales phage]|uniref:Uncharacterized protein n=1 Tax=uncultured Caudovirales phage TaxID=2100421 RepID=A0A6J5SQJ2_9CAUD|nr:hypothetical protein UFOVP1590_9 [uncultured Caudovirales phage]